MAVWEKQITADELWEIVHLPENSEKRMELVRGEIIEMAPAGGEHGGVAANFLIEIGSYVKQNHIGKVTAAETGFALFQNEDGKDTVRAPDVGFITKERAPERLPKKYIRVVPDLVVEVVSPNDSAEEIQDKLNDYRRAGVRLIVFAYPSSQTMNVYTPNEARTLNVDDTFDGGDVLPGFTLPVRAVFES
jgi:Uma2 family endonuclease